MAIIETWEDVAFISRQIQVDVLRLDRLHPTVSGNKWLKLKGYLQQAIDQKKDGIITKGGPWSNHAHACAYACRLFGLNCNLWIKGHEKQQTATIKDCLTFGASIRYVNRQAFYDEETPQLFAHNNNLAYIPLGGAGNTGVECVTAYMQQLTLPAYSHAICAVGTGTTFAGLAFSPGNFTNIIGIESGTNDDNTQQLVAQWQQQLPAKKLQLHHEFTFGGYSKHTPELLAFMNEFYQKHHIPTDIVYTGKLFYAVQALAKAAYFTAGSRLLIIHSGGLQGNRSLPQGLLQF